MTTDRYVFVGCLCALFFWCGLELGMNHLPQDTSMQGLSCKAKPMRKQS